MMLTWSKWGLDPSGSSGLSPEDYPEAEWVPKPRGPGKRERIRRVPRPEVLVGSARRVRTAIDLAPGKWKYRSAVMSFAPEDIDVACFNAGAPDLRRQIDFALSMFLDWCFAGVPVSARPPVFVTTHTHTGRLEVNVLIPRWVLRPDGALRSYNPDPPRRGARQGLQDLQSVLNVRFGWADPFDPSRRQLILAPDWEHKIKAETKRQGDSPPTTLREKLIMALLDELRAGNVTCAETLRQATARVAGQQGLDILTQGRGYVTLGALNAAPKDRIRLRGPLFEPGYFAPSAPATHRNPKETLERLEKAWEARALWNRGRYGDGRWPHQAPALAQRLRNAGVARLTLIPPRHYHLDLSKPAEEPHVPSPFDATGNTPSLATARPRDGAARSDPRTGSRDCGSESRDGPTSARTWRFAEFAEFLAGPGGPRAVLAALRAKLAKSFSAGRTRKTGPTALSIVSPSPAITPPESATIPAPPLGHMVTGDRIAAPPSPGASGMQSEPCPGYENLSPQGLEADGQTLPSRLQAAVIAMVETIPLSKTACREDDKPKGYTL